MDNGTDVEFICVKQIDTNDLTISNKMKAYKEYSNNNIEQVLENKNRIIMTDDEYEILKTLVLFKCIKCKSLYDRNHDSNSYCILCNERIGFYCKICLASFNKVSKVMHHLVKFHQQCQELKHNLDFRCWKCGIAYKLKIKRDKHELDCDMIPNFKCKICPALFTNKRILKVHNTKRHNKVLQTIELDDVSYEVHEKNNLFKALKNHILAICIKCKKSIKVQKDTRTCRTCCDPLVYKCKYDKCSKKSQKYDLMDNLIFHLRQEHLQSHICEYCGCNFNTEEEFLNHIAECLIPKKRMPFKTGDYKCEQCQKTFKTEVGLKVHWSLWCKFTDKSKQYYCEHCSYKAYRMKNLLDHLKENHVHVFTGKKLKCQECGTTWCSIHNFNYHKENCTGDIEIELRKQKLLRKQRHMTML